MEKKNNYEAIVNLVSILFLLFASMANLTYSYVYLKSEIAYLKEVNSELLRKVEKLEKEIIDLKKQYYQRF